jgi:hypothetical protein
MGQSMKDELEQYWNGYFDEARRAVQGRDARLMRMLERSLGRDRDVADILRQWRAANPPPRTKRPR